MPIKLIPITAKKRLPGRAKIIASLASAVRQTVVDGQRRMAEYPSKPPGSSYRRTGTLKRSWSHAVDVGGNRIEGRVQSNSNMAPYNKEVQGILQDPLFFSLGWRDVRIEAAAIAKDLIARTRRAMADLVG